MSEDANGDRLVAARAGDRAAWGALLSEHDERLQRMIAFRMDARLRGRIDVGDVLQEAFAEAAEHREQYFAQSPVPPVFVWLRAIAGNKLLELHRQHLAARMRSAAREISADGPGPGRGEPDATAVALVAQLSAGVTGPATRAARAEVAERLHHALQQMDTIDREVLALRHFEQLSNAEAAEVLGIKERAAAKRYLRALQRLKDLLAELPGGLTGLRP